MQTKQQIRQLLSSVGISPNKRLGQHFLIDLNLMRLLVESAGIKTDDVVLEVGCGTGSLTEALIEHAGGVISVEYDQNLAEIATRRLSNYKNVKVINTDILESKHLLSPKVTDEIAQAREQFSGRLLLVSNLPYNVASPVMLNLVMGVPKVDEMYVTVQKEVADRMTAGTGSEHYGILSIFLAVTGVVNVIRILKPTVFWPRPQVDSAMVCFIRDKVRFDRITDIELFCETVHLFMSHRRKTIKSCCKLADGKLGSVTDWPKILEQCGIDPLLRPEKLKPEDYVALADNMSKSLF